MVQSDNLLKDKSYEKLLHDTEYYQNIFKKTEKIVSVVFYILNNVEVDKKSETHTSNLASKAHFAHENALRTLETKPATAREVLEQFAQSLIGLESTIRISRIASVIPQDVHDLLCSEIALTLRNLSEYIEGDDVLASLLTEPTSTTARTTRRPAQRAATTAPRSYLSNPTPASHSGGDNDRRTRIKTILEAKGEASIKDISEIVTDVSEKTIQRELNAMIEDNVVKREGERRWSKYSLA